MSQAETEERTRLDACQASIRGALADIEARLGEYADEIQTRKEYLWEARRDMDHIEKIAVRQTVEQTLDSAEILKEQQQKLAKLMRSPYFGRFDFKRSGEGEREAIYVGVHHFRDEAAHETLVYDWRAPISSMFYDFETGPAHYEAPEGKVEGDVSRKRQFRIRDGEMEFVLETGVNIVDDVLQTELSRASGDEGMKNIVATIQRDQNAIIRNDDAHTLIIQGVAGSGKTSIALHRIAYLLYRHKDTLSSNDILIISPNRVFADYIGNVLPELGEEQVPEIGMEDLAEALLDGRYRFQTFFEQTAQFLEKADEALRERVVAKASVDFLREIDRYVEHVEAQSFQAAQWRTGRKIVPDWFFAETWPKHRGLPHTERIQRMVAAAEQQIGFHYNHTLEVEDRRSLREAIRGMVRKITLRQAYQGLFEWMGRPELFKQAGGKLEYADVFPLIYLKMRLEGSSNPYRNVKHLLIDEMQDYTPVQYAVLGRLFSCRKTVLGDATQSVNPYSASTAEHIRRGLQSASSVKLTKSYRSTWEIMQFALAIAPNPELEAMKRHGEPPRIVTCARAAQMTERIKTEIEDFKGSDHDTLALIAKTQRQANRLHKSLWDAGINANLLDTASAGFSSGVVVCTSHLAKGLEFDRVIVADVSAQNYHSEMDRNLLYVACTRAMHRLTLIAVGQPSALLPQEKASG
ncbi:MAG: 3'-5' exonuclease [Cellvibrionaceae bacterium]